MDKRFSRPGEKNPNAKLTAALVATIRSEYVPRKVTAKMLAKKYGVFYQTVHRIIRGDNWA